MRSRRLATLSATTLATGLAGVLSGTALAQSAGPGVVVTPTLSVTQTFTDNYRGVDAAAAGNGRAESITSISPGISVVSRRGWVQGSLSYGLSGVLYGRNSQASDVQQRLSAALRGEIVPQHLDVNLSASISRQASSAFGTQVVDGSLTDRNQTEVRALSLQPVVRGVLGGALSVQATARASFSDGGAQGGSRGTGATLTLAPVSAGRVISWSLNGSRQSSDFDGGRETTTDRLIASLFVRPRPELEVSVRGGVERSNLDSIERKQYENYGAGILWTPTPRTRVQLDGDKRQFGDAHSAVFEHRMRRSVWRYSDSRSVNDGGGQTAAGGTVSAYDLFFELFASQEPDPAARDVLVRDFLQRNGVSPDTQLGGGGFLTNAVSVQRRQELSLALNGLRTSWTVAVFQTRTERADTLSGAVDDLSAGPVRQRGLSVTVNHRLTPLSSISLAARGQRSDGIVAGGGNALDSLTLGWTTRVGRNANLALTVRHASYDDPTEPYSENAISAAFSTRF